MIGKKLYVIRYTFGILCIGSAMEYRKSRYACVGFIGIALYEGHINITRRYW